LTLREKKKSFEIKSGNFLQFDLDMCHELQSKKFTKYLIEAVEEKQIRDPNVNNKLISWLVYRLKAWPQ